MLTRSPSEAVDAYIGKEFRENRGVLSCAGSSRARPPAAVVCEIGSVHLTFYSILPSISPYDNDYVDGVD